MTTWTFWGTVSPVWGYQWIPSHLLQFFASYTQITQGGQSILYVFRDCLATKEGLQAVDVDVLQGVKLENSRMQLRSTLI